MRRILFVALLALALPMAAFANSTSTDFIAISGTLGGLGGGSAFDTGSTILLAIGFNGAGFTEGSNLGTLSFSTGSLISKTSGGVQTFASGGTFTITGSGLGLPGGTLFSGTFSGSATLIPVGSGTNNTSDYLSCENGCSIVGQWANGLRATGKMMVVEKGGAIEFAYVNLQTPVVPEPGTLSLLGTGLLGLGMVVRRKLRV